MKARHIFIFTLLLFAACASPTEIEPLYPIDKLVADQLAYLRKMQPKLKKEALLGNEKSEATFTPDSIEWAKELEIFRELSELNNPANKGLYIIDDNLYDPSSNLTVKAFTSIEELPVRSLRVFYQEDVRMPRKIEAEYSENLRLYRSTRRLTMTFQQLNNKMSLVSYSMEGGQQVILGDSIEISIKATIQYK